MGGGEGMMEKRCQELYSSRNRGEEAEEPQVCYGDRKKAPGVSGGSMPGRWGWKG